MGERIIEQRLNYLLGAANGVSSRDSDMARQSARGLKQVIEELREVYERCDAVEELVRDAAESGDDVQAYKVLDALRGPAEPATEEQTRLWKKYFDNEYNERVGAHVPVERFLEKKNLFLRCNRCAYLVGGWVHVEWHEVQPEWMSEKMMIERKEKLGE